MEENNKNFKTIQNPKNEIKVKNNISFGRSVLLPFFSGVVGCTVVLGTCFGIPSIRSKILDSNATYVQNPTSNSQSSRLCEPNFTF